MNETTSQDPVDKAAPLPESTLLLVRVAGLAMGPTIALIVLVAVQQFVAGDWPLAAWNVMTALATIAAALFVLKRVSAAYSPALVLSYFNSFWCGFLAVTRSSNVLWIGCVTSAVAALALTGGKKAFPGHAAAPKASKEDNLGAWTRENIEAIVVAFIMALIIRCFCIEVFKIPTSSMEPTLMGDKFGPRSSQGDRIMVTKYYYALNPIERFDVVVFKFPLNQVKNFIKRIVGLPGEDFCLDRGNIWTRPTSEPTAKFRIARKPYRIQQSIWIPVDRDPDESFDRLWEPEDPEDRERYVLEGNAIKTLQHNGSKSIRFHSRATRISDGAGEDVPDLRIAFDLELLGSTGTFSAVIPNEFGRFTLELSPDQLNQIRFQSSRRSCKADLRLKRLAPERPYHIEFMVYDGLATVAIDGQQDVELRFLETHDDLEPPEETAHLELSSRDLLFLLTTPLVSRDVHHKPPPDHFPQDGRTLRGPGEFVSIPAEHYMMMGDNVTNSHDARKWLEETFELNDGTVYRCENQDLHNSVEEWKKRHGNAPKPDWYLPTDHIGYERGFSAKDLKRHETRDYRFVHEKYIVGKALWVWWPPGRWFRLIR